MFSEEFVGQRKGFDNHFLREILGTKKKSDVKSA